MAAVRFAAISGQYSGELLSLVAATEPVDVQIAAVGSVVHENAGELLARFRSLSPSVRSAILDAVLAREVSAMMLLESLQQHHIPLQAIGPGHRQRLKTHVNKKVRAKAEAIFRKHENSSNRKETLARYQKVSPIGGDPKVGSTVFSKHCAACHRVRGIGHVVGPDLAAIANRSPQAMVTAILDPNAAVEDKYRSYTVLTLDGIAETGVIEGETSTSIELRLQDGKSKTILREDIELFQSTGKSLMPEELEKNISPRDMSHLLAFLNDVGPPAKKFPGNVPVTVTPNNAGTIRLAATNCRIYGDQIRFEPVHNNIGYWSNQDDYVQWTLEVEQMGRYEVWLDYACPDHTAGNAFSFTCGSQTLAGSIDGTGTWDDYRQVKLGTIDLAQSKLIAAFGPEPGLKRWLLDLRAIELKPVQ
jgi:putative heme-binding domain-containing protein